MSETETSGADWPCPKCEEPIEQTVDVCWQCGADRAGVPNPYFVPPELPAEPADEGLEYPRLQFRIKHLLPVFPH